MIPINTPLTKHFGLKTPIILAPMGSVATPELASVITAAGALGTIGAAFDATAGVTLAKIQKIKTILNIAPGTPVPVAIGLIGWKLDKTEVSDDPRLPAILNEHPAAIFFAFGDDLGKYIGQVHEHDKKHGRKTFIFVQLGTVEDAVRYAPQVDCIVVQGNEAGGHGRSDAPPMFSLLQAVLSALPSGPMVVAAGGISTGAQIAALLTMGAAGVLLGTRFLFTPECPWPLAKKDALLKLDLNPTRTVRTLAYDEVGRSMGWPPKHDGRAIRNKVMDDVAAGLSLDERLARYDESTAKGEDSRLIVWAGVGAGITSEIKPAADVVRELHEEAVQKLSSVDRFLAGGV